MTEDPVLFMLGTPLAGWLPTATALTAGAPGGIDLRRPAFAAWHDQVLGEGPPPPRFEPMLTDAQRAAATALAPAAGSWGGLDPRACWTAEFLAERFPRAAFLVFVESPAEALAAWLTAGVAGDPAAALRLWMAGARRLLRLAHRDPERCLLVDATEARRHGAALALLCRDRFGVVLQPLDPAEVQLEPLTAALGAALAAADRGALALHAELHAGCTPLGAAADAVVDPLGRFDAADVVQRWHELRRVSDAQRRSNDTLRLEAKAHEARLLALRTELEQVRGRAETERAQSQARQLQVQRSEAEAHEARLLALRTELDQARGQAAAEHAESELLLLQLHQVQEELEHYYLEYKKLESLPVAPPAPVTARIEIASERDTPPHRELGLVWHRPAAGDAPARSDIRLVEHRGHPGLTILAADGPRQLLSGWQESGREDDRPYLLLLPADAGSLPVLQRLPASDWLTLQALLDDIDAALHGADPDHASRWHGVANRLRAQLAELPARLRYDRLDVRRSDDADAALDVSFAHTLFGARRFDALRLRWRPGHREPLDLLAPADGVLPLASWPLTDDGGWPPAWPVPLGSAVPDDARRRRWRSLPAVDRDLLLGVLDALPAVADRLAAQDLPEGLDRAGLAQAARQLLQQALQALRPSRRERLASALRGRAALAA